MSISFSFPAHLHHLTKKQLAGRLHASTALHQAHRRGGQRVLLKYAYSGQRLGSDCGGDRIPFGSLSCARHRCLDGNGSPRAAWLFFSFEAACKKKDRRTQITVV